MESRQPAMWAASLVTYAAALIAFLLRLLARRLKRVQLAFDDYLALFAFVSVLEYVKEAGMVTLQ
jgi:hypothetical protein